MDVVGKTISRLELMHLFSRLLHRDRSLEVALHANRIAPLGRQLGRVQNRALAASMVGARPMTPPTANASMQERFSRKVAVRPGDRTLHPARVTVQAVDVGRQVEWNLQSLRVGWRHVPSLLLRVPIDGRFEPESILGKKVRPALAAGTNEVLKFALAANLIFPAALIAHPHLALLLVDAVVDPGFSVFEFAGGQPVARRTAGCRHRGLAVGIRDLSVTGSTHLSVACVRWSNRGVIARSLWKAETAPCQQNERNPKGGSPETSALILNAAWLHLTKLHLRRQNLRVGKEIRPSLADAATTRWRRTASLSIISH